MPGTTSSAPSGASRTWSSSRTRRRTGSAGGSGTGRPARSVGSLPFPTYTRVLNPGLFTPAVLGLAVPVLPQLTLPRNPSLRRRSPPRHHPMGHHPPPHSRHPRRHLPPREPLRLRPHRRGGLLQGLRRAADGRAVQALEGRQGAVRRHGRGGGTDVARCCSGGGAVFWGEEGV